MSAELGEREQLVELATRERHPLGRALHLDEPGLAAGDGAQHDDVHVDLGRAVLDVGQVEHRRAADDADADRRAVRVQRVGRQLAAACTSRESASWRARKPPQMLAVRVPPSACSTSQSTTTWRSPSTRHVARGTQAAGDEPLDLDGAPALLALGRLAVDALGRRARQHRVLGRDPALAAPAHPARHVLVDRRGAQHARLAERHEARAGGHLGEVALERHGSQRVGGAAIGTGHGGVPLSGPRQATDGSPGYGLRVRPARAGRPNVAARDHP